jgi:hypothetical protein
MTDDVGRGMKPRHKVPLGALAWVHPAKSSALLSPIIITGTWLCEKVYPRLGLCRNDL